MRALTCFKRWKRSKNEPSLENTLAGFCFSTGAGLDTCTDAGKGETARGGTTNVEDDAEGVGEGEAYPLGGIGEMLDIILEDLEYVSSTRTRRWWRSGRRRQRPVK